jgi:hypothetical protein
MAFGPTRVVDSQTNLTASTVTPAIKVKDIGRALNLLVDVTARVAGTLDITVEWSHDGGTSFAPAETPDAFAQLAAVELVINQFVIKAPTYRLRYVVATTPDFDFTVSEFVT